jgi:hypothetical protein
MNLDFKKISESKKVRGILIGIVVCVILLVILSAGINIGEHKARFAGQFGDNFERNFVGPRDGMMGGNFGRMMPGGHGTIGEILSINLPQIIVSGPDNLEKTVLISTSTLIRRFQENIKISDLKTGDFVVIIGNPNQNGQIEAKLIRMMPNPNENKN